MAIIRSTVKAILPQSVRLSLRSLHRRFVFSRTMKRLFADSENFISNPGEALADMIYAWDNSGWSATQEYLRVCLEHAQQASGPILECGSGLTTIMLGAVAQEAGNTMWSLEHHQQWGERVGNILKKFEIDSVRMNISPLHDYGEFSWYIPPVDSMPGDFSLVICDGPPADTPGGRYGLLPVLRSRLKPGCVILLDDATRQDEREIAAQWASELSTEFEILGSEHPYIKLTIPQG